MEQHLNFAWRFILGFDEAYINKIPSQAEEINLPHNMVDFPFSHFSDIHHQKIGTYFKLFTINDYDPEQSYILDFSGVMVSAEIYVNGRYLGQFAHGYLPFEVDISDYVTAHENLVVVKVDGREKDTMPPWGGVVDYLSFAGIYREVRLFSRQALDILYARVDGTVKGEVICRPTFCNEKSVVFTAIYEVYDHNDTVIHTANKPRFFVPHFEQWSLKKPYLYRLKITLMSIDGRYHASRSFTLAFRSIQITPLGVYLNNEYIKLVGLNRHETYPYLGGAAPQALQEDDVLILKSLGLNYVRCSHYPPSPHFLDACDKHGLLVVDEVPGWQHIGDLDWQKQHLDNIKRMIIRDYNHPSVILWSIRINESNDSEDLYVKSQEVAKSLDPYRPTTGTRNFTHSQLLEDVYSYNDFSHDGTNAGLLAKRKVTKSPKPYIVSECNGHMYPCKIYDQPAVQASFISRHLAVLDSAFKHQDIVGISPWCMHDYYTHHQFGSGDHICYHGVLDSFRNPKLVSYVYQSCFSDDFVLMPSLIVNNGDIPEAKLTPFFVLSNAKKIALYRGEDLVKQFFPRKDLYPHLPNPPFIIDYFIRQNFLDHYANLTARNKKTLGKILNRAAVNGLNHMSVFDKLRLFIIMKTKGIKYEDLVTIWGDNVTSWGQNAGVFTLKAYNGEGQLMKTQPIGASSHYTYHATITKTKLVNAATYDLCKITITSLDNNKLRMPYDFSHVHIETSGPIKLFGPSHQALHGGALAIYVGSKLAKGKAHVSMTINKQKITFDLTVE